MIDYSLMFACSQDGFIAKKEGDNPSLWTSEEDHKLLTENISKSDWSVMGRKTHELNLREDRKRIVFTRKVKNIEPISVNIPNQLYFNPDTAQWSDFEKIVGLNSKVLVLGGTRVHDFFLYLNLLSNINITIEPLTFNTGIRAFSFINFSDLESFLIARKYIKKQRKINEKTILVSYSR
jgi:dihydrofolate reductase|tara:strand:- start:3253 stop:3789 length:537 start_codon:yes stop_codon:yes gene_type:complete